MKKYSENHEWVELGGDIAVVGITKYAAEQLGDLVFAELPSIDSEYHAGDTVAVLESVKTASDIYTPCSGKVVAINDALEDDPELVNREPEGQGWLFKVHISDPTDQFDSLMDQSAYQSFLDQ